MVALLGTLAVFGTPALMFKWWLNHKQLENRPPSLPPASEERLARMEQAIDSIAIEIERISEGQRFTTKLLSERSGPDASGRTS
ncbi:MAG: hypothetical protein M3081_03255 [Gemmatimonadota bacterium]|nr:hypothetical protein [Gemmatimonadota bacterium]